MILCGIVAAIMAVVWISGRKRFSKEWRNAIAIILGAAVLGGMLGVRDSQSPALLEGNLLARSENGEGSYQQQLELWVEDAEDAIDYELEVPEQKLTEEEEMAYLAAAGEELAQEFPGGNESVNCIREKVVIRDEYQDGRVLAEWQFDNYKIMDSEGNVIAEEISEDGELVKASVELSCGDSYVMEEFYFRVFPRLLNAQETFLQQLEKLITVQGELAGENYLELPEQVDEYEVKWTEKRDTTPEKVLLFGVVLAVFVPLLERSRQQEQEKQRNRLLEMEYPDMVSKITLLLSSGMTLQGAFRKVASSYEDKHRKGIAPKMPAYEEMLMTCREMESGVGEGTAYERFGERCGLSCYRKFGNTLAQNLKKGSKGIVGLLEQEAENAFEERKAAAKRYGEEAGTKLLLPMMSMLGIVMLILIIPAVFAFQI